MDDIQLQLFLSDGMNPELDRQELEFEEQPEDNRNTDEEMEKAIQESL